MNGPLMYVVATALGLAALSHVPESGTKNASSLTARARTTLPPVQKAFVVLHNGSNSGFTRNSEFVIQDIDEYLRRWKGVLQGSPDAERPVIDFEKTTVVFVALGIRNTEGHSVHVDSVTAQPADGATVHYTVTTPSSRCMSLQLLTSPIEVISFERVTGVVKFKKRGVSGAC